jgi:iron complex transport system substrate-binding protein
MNTITRPRIAAAASGLGLLALAACGSAPSATTSTAPQTGYPVTITSCGTDTALAAQPQQLVTLNEGATLVALALGLEKQMAGTAYLDDAIPAKWKAAYDSVPVLSDEYPSLEKLLAAHPDLAYASYGSAFDAKEGVATTTELAKDGIATYVSPFGCVDKSKRAAPTWDSAWSEIETLGKAFNVAAKATTVIDGQKQTLEALKTAAVGKGLNVLWYDSGTKTPTVGGGGSGPQLILDAVGAHNIFGDLEGGWPEASWEKVVAANPDAIVLADASWDTAQAKIDYLEHDPVLSQLAAVRNHRYVVLPFSESTPGVLLIDGATAVSEGLKKLGISK